MRSPIAAVASVIALAQPTVEFTPVPSYPTPPPVSFDASSLSGHPPAPDQTYQRDKECVKAGSGASVEARPWGQMDLNFEQVWRFGRGDGQLVAVIDTGVNKHPRFDGRLRAGGDYVSSDGDGTTDCDGHGTLVAGIIAANDEVEKEGFKGVAPGARILAIRQSSKAYGGQKNNTPVRAGDHLSLAKAIVRATDEKAGVINISSVICTTPNSKDWPELRAAVRYARDHNSVVVAAAGNVNDKEGSNCRNGNRPDALATVPSPAWYDEDVLTVGALDKDGSPASFTLGGPWVDVAAPGTQHTSLDPGDGAKGLANRVVEADGQLYSINGTSFATPYVSGVVALVRARYPQLSPVQVMERIKKTARQPQGRSGRDFHVGYGMVDPVAALTAVLPEEQGINPLPPVRSTVDIAAPAPADTRPLTVALVGSGIGLGVLALTHLAVRALRRRRTA
ncbi:type VII secretion-associated serine protease mycosin [Allokutzneria oryzae]|uniref:Type VII secretion-associated serine protease mycosin n=1 Tax=Allokutzneria oryzae TaxID=1378989 RepID=A0ABV6A1R3_9PSEU